jgi:hypothetical protein
MFLEDSRKISSPLGNCRTFVKNPRQLATVKFSRSTASALHQHPCLTIIKISRDYIGEGTVLPRSFNPSGCIGGSDLRPYRRDAQSSAKNVLDIVRIFSIIYC